ncbi:low-density lipoprotein receptor-related protein 12-like [Haliotis cracherodii]|uniref:low-density lipoprotein receptor-related protein 12-like n=1 Tax=Haliotis cracherodii TaxID=6455 RepID=UPI0039E8BFD5
MELYVNIILLVMIGTRGVSQAQKNTPKTFELSEECGNTIIISEDMLLKLSVNKTRKKQESCKTLVESDVDGNRLLVRLLSIDIPGYPDCSKAGVHVSQIEGKHASERLCGTNITTPVFNSSGQSVGVWYHSNRGEHEASQDVFTLLITSFHEQINGACTSYDFTCSNSLCIDSDMTCNSFDDCSDNSDETIGCNATEGNQLVKKVVIVSVCCGVFLLAVVCVFAVKIHRARNRRGSYLPID